MHVVRVARKWPVSSLLPIYSPALSLVRAFRPLLSPLVPINILSSLLGSSGSYPFLLRFSPLSQTHQQVSTLPSLLAANHPNSVEIISSSKYHQPLLDFVIILRLIQSSSFLPLPYFFPEAVWILYDASRQDHPTAI